MATAIATGLTEDEALARALDLSAAEARARNEAPLPLAQEGPNAGEFRPRSEAHPPLSHHFAQQVPAMGGIISRGALDQFHDFWSAAIGKHQTAGSICGYLTAANCELLSEALAPGTPACRVVVAGRWCVDSTDPFSRKPNFHIWTSNSPGDGGRARGRGRGARGQGPSGLLECN